MVGVHLLCCCCFCYYTGDICVADPSMLEQKGKLLKLAHKSVDESGYSYKKGKPRSSVFGTGKDPAPKRKKLTQDFRDGRITEINDKLETVRMSIDFKEKRVEAGVTSKNYVIKLPKSLQQ